MKNKLESVNMPKPKDRKAIDGVEMIDGKITANFTTEKRGGKLNESMAYVPPVKRIFDDFNQFSEAAESFFGISENEIE